MKFINHFLKFLPQALRVDCLIQCWFQTRLQQGTSEPDSYDDLVFISKTIFGKPSFQKDDQMF